MKQIVLQMDDVEFGMFDLVLLSREKTEMLTDSIVKITINHFRDYNVDIDIEL